MKGNIVGYGNFDVLQTKEKMSAHVCSTLRLRFAQGVPGFSYHENANRHVCTYLVAFGGSV